MRRLFTLLGMTFAALVACTPAAPASPAASVVLQPGQVMFIASYADWWSTWQANAPIVNGLEEEFANQIEFIRLDGDDPATYDMRQQYGLVQRTRYVLVDSSGMVMLRWFGPLYYEAVKNDIADWLNP